MKIRDLLNSWQLQELISNSGCLHDVTVEGNRNSIGISRKAIGKQAKTKSVKAVIFALAGRKRVGDCYG
jgi:hypothetical protein